MGVLTPGARTTHILIIIMCSELMMNNNLIKHVFLLIKTYSPNLLRIPHKYKRIANKVKRSPTPPRYTVTSHYSITE